MTSRRVAIVAMLGMAGAAALAEWARPQIKVSDAHKDFKLEELFPRRFAGWTVDDTIPVILPPPDQQALLDKIYNQTLARTYVNQRGQRVMLSVAYGGDQSDGLSVHVPDVCYVAQGFRQITSHEGRMAVPGVVSIPVRHLMMVLGNRQEAVTYWVLMGDEATVSNAQRRMVAIRYGLRRLIPEGMLVRVSSINPNLEQAIGLHQQFSVDLINAVPTEQRARVVGATVAPA